MSVCLLVCLSVCVCVSPNVPFYDLYDVTSSDTYRQQLRAFVLRMQGTTYQQKLQTEVDAARDNNHVLRTRVNQLEKQVSSLQAESIAHLNARLAEVMTNELESEIVPPDWYDIVELQLVYYV